MKKIISVILSVAVLVSALTITTSVFASSNNDLDSHTAEQNAYYVSDTPLFESSVTGNFKDWIYIDKTLSASNATIAAGSGNSADGRATFNNGPITSLPILTRDNNVKTAVSNFEWKFTFAGIGQVGSNQVDFYMFHVNDNSDYETIAKYKGGAGSAGFADTENVFVIARSRRNTDDGLKQNAFTIMQPTFDKNGNSLGLRPISYTESSGKIIPDESAYMSIPGTNIADINTFMTIKATLIGNQLTLQLSIDPTRNTTNEWYYVEKTFTLSDEALKAAPAGDFVVSSPGRPSDATGTVCYYKNMSIKEVFTSINVGKNILSPSALLKTPAERKQWLYIDSDKSSSETTLAINENYDGRNVIYNGPAVSKPILALNEANYSTVTNTSVVDFKWNFEYAAATGRENQISFFMFHVNENSEYSVIKDYNGIGGDGVKAGLDEMSNVFAVAFAYKKTDDGLKEKAFTVLQPTKVGEKVVLRPIAYTEANGVVTPSESSYLSVAGTNFDSNRNNWSTLSMTLVGNKLTLNVKNYSYDAAVNLEKTFTLSDDALKLAPAGDFAVSAGSDHSTTSNRVALFKDMVIYEYNRYFIGNEAVNKFELDMALALGNAAENEAVINFGDYALTVVKSAQGDKAVLYKNDKQLAVAGLNIDDGKAYDLKLVYDKGNISVKLCELGKEMPNTSIIDIFDKEWLIIDEVYLSSDNGEFETFVYGFDGSIDENSAADSTHTVIANSGLVFEKAESSTAGRITLQNKAIIVSGKNAEDKDGWVVTKGVTGKQLTDYTLKYTYSVADNKWTVDAVMLRVQDSENPDRMTGYSFAVQGLGDGKSASYMVDGKYPEGSVVSIQKDSTTAVTSTTADANKSATVLDYTLSVGTDYTVEIEVKGATINAWLYKAGADKPTKPTVSYTDPAATYKSGDIGFVGRGEGFSLSEITLIDKANGTICENYVPELYNSKVFSKATLNAAARNVGLVNLNNGVYTLKSTNGLNDVVYPLETNGLNFKRDTYLSNFELCYELSFNGIENNAASVYFNVRDYYENCYELRVNAQGSIVLYKNGVQEKTASFSFIDGVRYQVVLNSNNGKINVYIYRLTDVKSSVPTLSFTDEAPLTSGYITFGTKQGSFNISKMAVKSYDKATVSGPTGTIFKKNFEGNDYNLNGLDITLNNTDHTTLMTDYDGNKYLRIVGKPSNAAKANDITGSDALSQVKFGSDELYNFDLSAKIRFKSAFSANWSYLAVGIHANPNRLRNEAIWLDVGTRGSAAVFIDTDENLSNNNMVASTGSVKGTSQTAFVPNETQTDGMAFDGQWHDLKVSVRENTYSLYVDGKFVLSYTDPENTYEKGAVYLYGYGVNYDLDDIKLTNNSEVGEVKKVNNIVYTNAEGFKLENLQKSNKLTGKQLSEFEWEFEYKASSSNWGRTAFLFGVNKDTKVKNAGANYLEMTNAFGFTITGTNINTKTGKPYVVSGIYNNGITAFAPNTDVTSNGNILPLVYTQEKDEEGKAVGPMLPTYTSTTSTRAALSFADTTTTPIDVGKWMTVKVRFVGNKLYIYIWQTGNKANTFRKQTFTMPMDAVNNITAGDFMIVNGDNVAQIRNIVIRDISVLSKKAK